MTRLGRTSTFQDSQKRFALALHFDPRVRLDDVRSLKRFFRSQPGVTSNITYIRPIEHGDFEPGEFVVMGPGCLYIVVRDRESGWRVVKSGMIT